MSFERRDMRTKRAISVLFTVAAIYDGRLGAGFLFVATP